jgi:hypothetical protein
MTPIQFAGDKNSGRFNVLREHVSLPADGTDDDR